MAEKLSQIGDIGSADGAQKAAARIKEMLKDNALSSKERTEIIQVLEALKNSQNQVIQDTIVSLKEFADKNGYSGFSGKLGKIEKKTITLPTPNVDASIIRNAQALDDAAADTQKTRDNESKAAALLANQWDQRQTAAPVQTAGTDINATLIVSPEKLARIDTESTLKSLKTFDNFVAKNFTEFTVTTEKTESADGKTTTTKVEQTYYVAKSHLNTIQQLQKKHPDDLSVFVNNLRLNPLVNKQVIGGISVSPIATKNEILAAYSTEKKTDFRGVTSFENDDQFEKATDAFEKRGLSLKEVASNLADKFKKKELSPDELKKILDAKPDSELLKDIEFFARTAKLTPKNFDSDALAKIIETSLSENLKGNPGFTMDIHGIAMNPEAMVAGKILKGKITEGSKTNETYYQVTDITKSFNEFIEDKTTAENIKKQIQQKGVIEFNGAMISVDKTGNILATGKADGGKFSFSDLMPEGYRGSDAIRDVAIIALAIKAFDLSLSIPKISMHLPSINIPKLSFHLMELSPSASLALSAFTAGLGLGALTLYIANMENIDAGKTLIKNNAFTKAYSEIAKIDGTVVDTTAVNGKFAEEIRSNYKAYAMDIRGTKDAQIKIFKSSEGKNMEFTIKEVEYSLACIGVNKDGSINPENTTLVIDGTSKQLSEIDKSIQPSIIAAIEGRNINAAGVNISKFSEIADETTKEKIYKMLEKRLKNETGMSEDLMPEGSELQKSLAHGEKSKKAVVRFNDVSRQGDSVKFDITSSSIIDKDYHVNYIIPLDKIVTINNGSASINEIALQAEISAEAVKRNAALTAKPSSTEKK